MEFKYQSLCVCTKGRKTFPNPYYTGHVVDVTKKLED